MSTPRTTRGLRRPTSHRAVLIVNLIISMALIAGGAIVIWANAKVGERLVVDIGDSSSESLTTPEGVVIDPWSYDTAGLRAKNFLLTGSDNGACPDKGDGTSGGIGDRTAFGERSDTIMILRVDPTNNDVAVLSFPRDLWVNISGTTRQARINSAFDAKDPSRLIQTIRDNFAIPVDHYVNVNLCAFKEIVDSVGGVKIPFSYRTKDERVGFREVGPGCVELRGSQALAYVRSRSGYKFFDETKQKWVGDPTGDIGRINRQQDFLRRSMQRALDRGTTNPATANALLNVALQRVITDDRITPRDLLQLAQAMRNLDTTGVNSYTVEWSMRRIGGESVLIPVLDTESMQVILSVFRGQAVVGQTSSNDGTNSQDVGATSPFVSIERTAAISTMQLATFLLEQMMNNDDSTSTTIPVVSPKQQRLGVFPPDDPTCR